jgi:small-conductance mechanosensitive channel
MVNKRLLAFVRSMTIGVLLLLFAMYLMIGMTLVFRTNAVQETPASELMWNVFALVVVAWVIAGMLGMSGRTAKLAGRIVCISLLIFMFILLYVNGQNHQRREDDLKPMQVKVAAWEWSHALTRDRGRAVSQTKSFQKEDVQ